MNLKSFHVFFIFASILLSGGLGFVGINLYNQTKQLAPLAWGSLGFITAGSLLVYLVWFIKKIKKLPVSQ